jgi:hypothetical protein
VINVPNRSHIHVRLRPVKFLLRHFPLLNFRCKSLIRRRAASALQKTQ